MSANQGRGQLIEAFKEFCDKGVALSAWPVEDLVRPSGPLFAPVGLKLHYLTLSGTSIQDREVASSSFACIRILTGKALTNACRYEAYLHQEEFPERPAGSTVKRPPPLMKGYSAQLLPVIWLFRHGASNSRLYCSSANIGFYFAILLYTLSVCLLITTQEEDQAVEEKGNCAATAVCLLRTWTG